jgi:hypothetical protein
MLTHALIKQMKKLSINGVSNDLLHFRVCQSHDSFTLLKVKGVIIFQQCQQAIVVLCTGYRQEGF